jgi:hypothetical protein
MIARVVQQRLINEAIVITLLPRVHRQSITRGDDMKTGTSHGYRFSYVHDMSQLSSVVWQIGYNNRANDFRPFRHFFDASSIYCPHHMGPIIERPRNVRVLAYMFLFCVFIGASCSIENVSIIINSDNVIME